MHEFAVAAELVEAALREAQQRHARRIERLECRVGAMRQIVPEMLVDAFALAAEGTPAEGAVLDVKTVALIVICRACGSRCEQREWTYRCPVCGSPDIRLEGGDELLLASVTLEIEDER
ncbi:MAG: hydrogenase maturation nickel metallochaperone HypA [Phycisphaerae bacterium]